MKISNKRELQQIASNHSSDNDFKNFMKLYNDCTKEPTFYNDYAKEPYSCLVNDTNFLLRFRKNLL